MFKKWNNHTTRGLVFFLASLLFFSAIFYFILPTSKNRIDQKDVVQSTKQTPFSYVAIGDSLTQGVGDTTNQGGFIPILSQELSSAYHYDVTSSNYGVSGNTSNQILKRMQEKTDIQDSLKTANLMTLTVGGNDVMSVIRKNFSDLSVDSFDKPAQAYQERLRKIIDLARADNKDLPIYVLGIYNPFYLNFPEMTEMQDVVDNWNKATEAVIKEYSNVYFVPINDLLYKGIDGQEGITDSSDASSDTDNTSSPSSVINDALFEGDHFHPNNTGYQIMSDAVANKISETKEEWKK
ncbi:SGNH/GDSL hydrolase family protein [Streptococcus dentiloxodontae]